VKRLWISVACLFAVAALVLFLRNDYDKAFICAALGLVAWFLSYRVRMRQLVKANEPAEELEESFESDEEN
jgi:hypothetical protein